jgi:hypothetical protein
VLLTVAGVASAVCSFWGTFAWFWGGAGKSHSVLLILFCLFPALSFIIFWLYFLVPRVGLLLSWLILSGTYLSFFFSLLEDCARKGCTTADSLAVGWGALIGNRKLWLLLVAPALCLLPDYTRPAPVAAPAIVPERADQDLRA